MIDSELLTMRLFIVEDTIRPLWLKLNLVQLRNDLMVSGSLETLKGISTDTLVFAGQGHNFGVGFLEVGVDLDVVCFLDNAIVDDVVRSLVAKSDALGASRIVGGDTVE